MQLERGRWIGSLNSVKLIRECCFYTSGPTPTQAETQQ